MNILLLGASGMAGHVITLYLREAGHTVDTLAATQRLDKQTKLLDVTDERRLGAFLDKHVYDVVVNCVGLLVTPSEEHKELAVRINALLPRFLEHRYAHTPTRVVHLSTDGVFSGKAEAYEEDAPCDGGTFYGRTKALGELTNDKDVTIRMSIIGPTLHKEGGGLFNWFLQQGGGEVSGYTNVSWCGVTTLELAKAIAYVLEHKVAGICHVAPVEGISKYDLLVLLKTVFQRDTTVKPAEGQGINTKLVSVRADFTHRTPSYPEMVQELKAWIESHKELYPHYVS
jgi:dTDP-4-dehydrorhamnose reductase